jgi:hypothetical protein
MPAAPGRDPRGVVTAPLRDLDPAVRMVDVVDIPDGPYARRIGVDYEERDGAAWIRALRVSAAGLW